MTGVMLSALSVLAGCGGEPAASAAIDVRLAEAPIELAGRATSRSSATWVAVLPGGRRIRIDAGRKRATTRALSPLRRAADAAPLARPAALPGGGTVDVAKDGALIFADRRLPVGALPDAQPVVGRDGLITVLVEPTRQYPHGAVGDELEAAAVALVAARPRPRVVAIARPRPGAVFEDLRALRVDVDGDGSEEIIVVESDEREGARIVAFDLRGRRLADSTPIGSAFRWHHALRSVPGPNGRPDIASVRTPHLGARLEFLRRRGSRLVVLAARDGYPTHYFGSRQLGAHALADGDGDGRRELVLPADSGSVLEGVRRQAERIKVQWRRDAGGRVTGPIATAGPAATPWLAAVRDDGTVRIWPPR